MDASLEDEPGQEVEPPREDDNGQDPSVDGCARAEEDDPSPESEGESSTSDSERKLRSF